MRMLQDHNQLTSEAATDDQKNAFNQWLAKKGNYSSLDSDTKYKDFDPSFIHRMSSTSFTDTYTTITT